MGKRMNYGLPYMGSKNKLAERVFFQIGNNHSVGEGKLFRTGDMGIQRWDYQLNKKRKDYVV